MLLFSSSGFVYRLPAVLTMDSNPIPPRDDLGIQSGHETQYLFSEGYNRESDANPFTAQPAAGKFVILQSIRFWE